MRPVDSSKSLPVARRVPPRGVEFGFKRILVFQEGRLQIPVGAFAEGAAFLSPD